MERIAFIGHKDVDSAKIKNRLKSIVEKEIQNNVCYFIMGTHGNFDKLALSVCRELKQKYKNIQIDIVLNSLHQISKGNSYNLNIYSDVNTLLFDTENVYFKRKIIADNMKMIELSTKLICYVDETNSRSNSKKIMNYAKKLNKDVINIFEKCDDIFFNLTKEEKKLYFEKFLKK